MSGDLTWMTLRDCWSSDGAPVTREEQITAALVELAKMMDADPTVMGATLILTSGERIDLVADRGGGPPS